MNEEIDIAKLDKALFYADDMLGRSQIEYMLFGDTAFSLINNTRPKFNKISLGIKRQDFTEFGKRILELTIPGAEIDDHKIKFFSEDEIPIEIRIINKHYSFFDNPDRVFYLAEAYWIPNPFDEYWRVYRLIL